MFEKLLDLMVSMWDWIKPGFIVDAFESGGVLRMGNYNRSVGPGFHWKWPFIEHAIVMTTCIQTERLPPQTVTTSDDIVVTLAAIVKYEIKDNIQPYIVEIYDQEDVLIDVSTGAIRSVVTNTSYEQLMRNPPEKEILDLIRAEVNKYGFKVYKVTFVDLARVRAIRLIQPHPKSLAN